MKTRVSFLVMCSGTIIIGILGLRVVNGYTSPGMACSGGAGCAVSTCTSAGADSYKVAGNAAHMSCQQSDPSFSCTINVPVVCGTLSLYSTPNCSGAAKTSDFHGEGCRTSAN